MNKTPKKKTSPKELCPNRVFLSPHPERCKIIIDGKVLTNVTAIEMNQKGGGVPCIHLVMEAESVSVEIEDPNFTVDQEPNPVFRELSKKINDITTAKIETANTLTAGKISLAQFKEKMEVLDKEIQKIRDILPEKDPVEQQVVGKEKLGEFHKKLNNVIIEKGKTANAFTRGTMPSGQYKELMEALNEEENRLRKILKEIKEQETKTSPQPKPRTAGLKELREKLKELVMEKEKAQRAFSQGKIGYEEYNDILERLHKKEHGVYETIEAIENPTNFKGLTGGKAEKDNRPKFPLF